MDGARPPCGGRLHHGCARAIDLRLQIEENLQGFEPVRSRGDLTGAAVAVVVMRAGQRQSVPIFQRPARMRRHAGQMALPGGRLHEGESVEACAVRELGEELGLEVETGQVLGRLDDFDTMSGFTIAPVVIWSERDFRELSISTDEVARLFMVDLDELRAAAAAARPGKSFSLALPEVEVFAPTAAILYQFSEVALEGRATRVADFFQPPWTHR